MTKRIGGIAGLGLALGCGLGDHDADGAWLELGWREPFESLHDGDDLELTTGSQGARMFPLAVRAGGFPLPPRRGKGDAPTIAITLECASPHEPSLPPLAMSVDAAPVELRAQPDGSLLFYYVALIADDDLELANYDGGLADLAAELDVPGVSPPRFDVQVVLRGTRR